MASKQRKKKHAKKQRKKNWFQKSFPFFNKEKYTEDKPLIIPVSHSIPHLHSVYYCEQCELFLANQKDEPFTTCKTCHTTPVFVQKSYISAFHN